MVLENGGTVGHSADGLAVFICGLTIKLNPKKQLDCELLI